jgi:hypothetical protein
MTIDEAIQQLETQTHVDLSGGRRDAAVAVLNEYAESFKVPAEEEKKEESHDAA